MKAETGWNGVATVRSVVAVLRSAPKKKTPWVGAGLLEEREQAWKEWQGEAELLANAIGKQCYGEDEFCECGKSPEASRREEKNNDGGDCSYL